jgi:hypothetical protein
MRDEEENKAPERKTKNQRKPQLKEHDDNKW